MITPAQPIPSGHDVQGRRQLHGPARHPLEPVARQRGLVQEQQPRRRRRDGHLRAVGHDGLDAAEQPGVGQADLRHPHDGQLRPGGVAASTATASSSANGRLVSHGRQRAGRELPDDRLAHVQLALGRADRVLPGREQRRPLRRVRARGDGAATSSTTSSRARTSPTATQGLQQGDHGHAGGRSPTSRSSRSTGRSSSTRTASSSPLRRASFEEEMQTKIVFVGGIGITAQTFAHENMHQWWGDAVSYAQPQVHVLQGGLRRHVGVALHRQHRRPGRRPGGLGRLQDGVRGVDRDPLRRPPSATTPPARRSGTSRRTTRRRAICSPRRTRTPARACPTSRCARSSARTTSARPARRSRPTYRYGSIVAVGRDRDLPQVHAEPVDRLLEQARRVLQAVVGHDLHGLPGGRQQAVDHRPGPGRRRLL